MLIAVAILMICVVGVMLLGAVFFNVRSDRTQEAKAFLGGSLPSPELDGTFGGNKFTGLGEDWLGKHFFAATDSGINNFKSKTNSQNTEQRFTFTTRPAPGLRNKHQQVLQLDYNVTGNPWWLRHIRDEIVQTAPGQYTGKIHVKVWFMVVTIGHFQLSSN